MEKVVQESEFYCPTSVARHLTADKVEGWLNKWHKMLQPNGTNGRKLIVKGWSFPAVDADKPRTTVTVRYKM